MRYLILIAVIIISACRFSSGRNNGDSAGNKYSLPDIPSFISDQSQRNSYLSEHFWDKFDFKDTSLVDKPATERFFVEYLNLVALSAGTSEKSLHNFMVRAMEQPLSREYYISLFEKYWGHPNSPYRNEEFYILFLESLLELELCDSFQSDIWQGNSICFWQKMELLSFLYIPMPKLICGRSISSLPIGSNRTIFFSR